MRDRADRLWFLFAVILAASLISGSASNALAEMSTPPGRTLLISVGELLQTPRKFDATDVWAGGVMRVDDGQPYLTPLFMSGDTPVVGVCLDPGTDPTELKELDRLHDLSIAVRGVYRRFKAGDGKSCAHGSIRIVLVEISFV